MTESELLEWGQKEDAARKADLANLSSPASLQRAKDNAKRRRKAAGLSAGQAARAVKLAQMKERWG